MQGRLLFLTALFVVAVFLFITTWAEAQIERVTVLVEGMACPFCAYGVEKKLKNIEGVEAVTVNMKEASATLSAKEGESIEISQVPPAIERAGFTPRTMRVVVVGRVQAEESKDLVLKFNDARQGFLLTDLRDDIKEKLLGHEGTGIPLEVRGIVRELSGGSWTLSPDFAAKVDDIQ